ncbi:MAG: hypothetical protein KDE31_13075 [Caldilineaceae bacterium]|nr:hypothetical protein [Caldilineaceae bacterium]
MTEKHNPPTKPNQPMIYQFRLQGHLDRQWNTWFDGLAITLEENGDTLLTGAVVDQAALYGLLSRIRDLGIPLISVIRLLPNETARPTSSQTISNRETQ